MREQRWIINEILQKNNAFPRHEFACFRKKVVTLRAKRRKLYNRRIAIFPTQGSFESQ
jgi:hypothetical protein